MYCSLCPSGVTAEMIKAAGEQAVDWLTSICNRIVKEETIPESWQISELVAIYKGKGDVLECSSSRGIKLLEQGWPTCGPFSLML